MNRNWQRPTLQHKRAMFEQSNPATAVTPCIKPSGRALEPGKQWLPHDGAQARARRLRQKMRQELKDARKRVQSNAVVGVEGDALILDFNKTT